MKVSDLVFGLMASHDMEKYSFDDLRYLSAPFNIPEANLRTNLSRMSAAMVIRTRREGKKAYYSFGDKGQRIRSNVVHGFVSLNWEEWNHAYWGVIFSVPEAHGENRHYIRKKLTKYRFACLNPGLWIRPIHPSEKIPETLHSILSSGFCHLIRFYNHREFTAEQIMNMWNLEDVNQQFYHGLSLMEKSEAMLQTLSPEMALVEKMTVGHTIVTIMFGDPMLPPHFLPKNWQGEAIREKFKHFSNLATERSKSYCEKILNRECTK